MGVRTQTPLLPEWAEKLLLLAILGLAFLLRMGWPTLSEFKRDEATVARLAQAIAYEGYLPATGVASSTGVKNFPLTLYLMALPLRLWSDPLAAVLFTGFLNGLAVLGCYLLGRSYFGQVVALLASYLFAVSSWAVLYGRKIWSQNLPLATILFFAFLFAALVRGRRWALVGAFIGLAVLIGLHLGGLAFIPILGLALLLYRKQVTRWPLLAGCFSFLCLVSPYLIHDALHGWENVRGFIRYTSGQGRLSSDALRYAFLMMGNEEVAGRMGGALHAEFLTSLPNLWWLNRPMEALLAAALVYGVLLAVRGPQERRRPVTLLLIWFFVPIALQSRPTAPVQPFYFNLLYPVQFLLIAHLVVDGLAYLAAWRPLRAAFMSLVLVLMLAWGAWQVLTIGRVLDFMAHHPTTGGYGIPLRYTREAALEARRLAGDAEILVLSRETDRATQETPAVFDTLLFGHPHRFADGRIALPLPEADTTVYLVGPIWEIAPDLEAVMARLEQMPCVQTGPAVRLPDGWSYRLFRRSHCPDREDALAGMVRFSEGLHFANGVSFLGYDVPRQAAPGEGLEVWLAWWVRAAPPPATSYHFFVHLVDETGHLLAQHDGVGLPTSFWRQGDLVLSHFAIPIPAEVSPGEYQVWSGMYTYPDIRNVSFLDVAGNPAGELALLGAVEIMHLPYALPPGCSCTSTNK
ncbi:MAG: glycosyltransferase family 39 protein [Anaerolineae bacterium]|nr:glycosyltransferase family 39 protein [Anaerolineae bacterium]